MAELTVKVDDYVPEFIALLKRGQPQAVLANTMAVARTIAEMYMKVWRKYASGDMVVPGKKRIQSRGPYTKSIQMTEEADAFEIFTDFKYHKNIEEGHPEIDLKPGLLGGPKARMGKHGAYNIVAFRHNTPGSSTSGNPMPVSIYKLMLETSKEADTAKAKGLLTRPGTSSVLKSSKDPTQRQYTWGSRLDTTFRNPAGQKDQFARRSKRATGYTWKSGKYQGMVRTQQSTSKAKRSGYITFRIVSANSDPRSWIVPPQDPIPIRQATVDFVDRTVPIEQLLRDAIEKDLG